MVIVRRKLAGFSGENGIPNSVPSRVLCDDGQEFGVQELDSVRQCL